MKLLITGASGLYGSKLAETALGRQYQVYAVHNQHSAAHGVPVQLDITEKAKVEKEISEIKPDAVVHAASMTNVDECDLSRELAWKINVEGTRNVAQAAEASKAFFLYISTDYVFDGEKGRYKETDLPSPINYYAYTKLKAEESVKGALINYCIARPSVIYGATTAAGKINFALWILNKLKNKEEIKVFVDQYNSPTLNTSLVDMTLEVLERRLTGVYHLSGASRISRYDFALSLAKTFGLDEALLVPARMKELSFPAKRPKDSSLNTAKAQRTLKSKPLKIEQAVEKLKTEMTQLHI
ncbi:MAG: dTDP-4-dehydrorhamnose reductase [Candidatus Bathyarchaeota archaeon]|nr:dTDP-4-dehydrorhamnose reductase [Candidatus Bathyarchaeota archaeon]